MTREKAEQVANLLGYIETAELLKLSFINDKWDNISDIVSNCTHSFIQDILDVIDRHLKKYEEILEDL